MTVTPAQPNYYDYLYWMHFNNNTAGLGFAKVVLGAGASGPVADTMREVMGRRETQYYNFLNHRLGETAFLAGSELTCADTLVIYRLTTGLRFGARPIDDLPNVVAYVKRIEARPAYQRAMQIAGPAATRPSG